ncbi:ATP-binding cassette domain-containing protein [Histidinibacterium lentulum]|uniref:ATP-binding cassette domain-containing protein n=1 Tax=Histidinibacterium lentulum TaxID=2480588 RepID=A0A3N2R5Y0_9RHOB|nr:ATP-binding cassette domain-containing protein [Histidinibacterium lentulum]ROU02892.1 ATP-binding cassette domain-containing protein [Histidinibacterium lentulum]
MDRSLNLIAVTIRRAGATLLSVDCEIAPGEVLSVMGPSGSGKSTLLSFVTGTLAPAFDVDGSVLLHGEDITRLPAHCRRIGLLFQDALLFPHMSVGQNLAFGLAPGPERRRDRRARIEAALAEVGLEGFAERDPATLSGGQRARVALMRMLLSEPCALLLDEPFSGLDAERRNQIRRLVFDRARARSLPVLMVTHDAEDAAAAGGRVLRIGGEDCG